MKYLLKFILLSSISFSALGVCSDNYSKDYIDLSTVLDIFKNEVNWVVQNQTNNYTWKGKNRHQIGKMLNQCTPTKSSKALLLVFAGTNAYNPRTFSLMAQLIQCANYQDFPNWIKKKSYSLTRDSLRVKKSKYTKWSGIEAGPMKSFISDKSLNKLAKDFDYANFASEESELLANPENMKNYSAKKFLKEYISSSAGVPKGIQEAMACTKKYFKKAKQLGIKPKLIIMSHSSGGRSVVKYLEQVKKYNSKIKADLVLTIDPVKEAHEAIKEVAGQKISNTIDDYNPFTDNNHKRPKVWSRKQPNSLYKTSNAKRWINFFQNKDNVSGDAGFMKFGIAGSPIHNADENYFINDKLGRKPHGGITYHDRTIEVMKKEIEGLFN